MTTPISSSFHFGNHSKEVHFSEEHIGKDDFDIKEGPTRIHINRSELRDAVLELKTEKYGEILGKILTWWAFLDLRFWKTDKSRDFKFLQHLGVGEVKIEDTPATKLNDLVQKVKEVALYFVDWTQYGVDTDVVSSPAPPTTHAAQEQDITQEQHFSLSGGPPQLTTAALAAISEDAAAVEAEEGMGERQNASEFFKTTPLEETPPTTHNL